FIFKQANRYRQRFGGRRIPPPPKVASSTKPAANDFESQSSQRMLEMQLVLERRLASLDLSQLSIGINQIIQAPQDHIPFYSQGSQADLVNFQDVAIDTRKITLDFNMQCYPEISEVFTQTDVAFMKNKNIQTEYSTSNCFIQTDKLKISHACVQTPAKLCSDKCLQVEKKSIETVDASTETEIIYVNDNTSTTKDLSNINSEETKPSEDVAHKDNSTRSSRESDSPPLSSEKATTSSNSYTFPFVSLFNTLAVRLPIVGT
ncbi:uncharacterized protein, partial [Epargyreus clarus]|uniref:uncharacterized protein n=1 Tax=Epargyreus clarus TaxID=520877 RepID=UPI003C2D15CB